MEGHLYNIAQTRKSDGVYSWTLKIVKEGQRELLFRNSVLPSLALSAKISCVGKIRINKIWGSALETPFGIGIYTALGELYIRVHIGTIGT